MTIHTSTNILMKMISAKSMFTTQQAKQQNKTSVLPTVNEQIRRDTVQISNSVKKADSDGSWTAKTYADGSIDINASMADYSRSQGGYLRDAVFGILNLDSVAGVYDECIANGMTDEEASRIYNEKLKGLLGNYQEALALALKFVPRDENAAGGLISYSDVYDENGQLKVPAKVTPEEYQKNLQSILDNMMNYLKTAKMEFPNLYKIYFAKQED